MRIVKLETKPFQDAFVRISPELLEHRVMKHDDSSIWIIGLTNISEQSVSYLEWRGMFIEDPKLSITSTSTWINRMYMGWSSDNVDQLYKTRPSQSIEIDIQVAECLSLTSHDPLILNWHIIAEQEINKYVAHRIFVEPISEDDWEILEVNACQVEDQFLCQVRVVYENFVFPLHLGPNATIRLRVTSTEPRHPFLIAQPNTEVIVTPRRRTIPRQSREIAHRGKHVFPLRLLPNEMNDGLLIDNLAWSHDGAMKILISKKTVTTLFRVPIEHNDIVWIQHGLSDDETPREAAASLILSDSMNFHGAAFLSPALRRQLNAISYREVRLEKAFDDLIEYLIDEIIIDAYISSIEGVDLETIRREYIIGICHYECYCFFFLGLSKKCSLSMILP
jgi:hypothetical protein